MLCAPFTTSAYFRGRLRLSLGSCNRSGAIPPFTLPRATLLATAVARVDLAAEYQSSCRLHLRNSHVPQVRQSVATRRSTFCTDLSSVRMVQFWVDGMRYGEGLSPVRPFDAGGFSCVVPAFNATLIQGYDRGAVSQEITVRLSEDGQRFVDAGISFVYYREPLLTGVPPVGADRSREQRSFFMALGCMQYTQILPPRGAALGGRTPVRAIAATGETLTCVLPPLPPGFVVGAKYSISVAIDGTSFIESVHGSGFAYYLPPATATIQPISGDWRLR